MGHREVIEHTADVGVRASADSAPDLFEQVTLGLLDITGSAPGREDDTVIEVELGDALDLGGLLVDWLSEVLYHQDARDLVITDVTVAQVSDLRVTGTLRARPRLQQASEGTPVKAITYHRLVVEQRDGVWMAQVFFDI